MNQAAPARLIIITDTTRAPAPRWLSCIEALLARAAPGSIMVQLRDRQLPWRQRQQFGARLLELCASHQQLSSVNERLDLALLLDADGVHLPIDGVSPDEARTFAAHHGRRWWVSVACHDPEAAGSTSADALLLSPVQSARKGRPALGLEGLGRALHARGARAAPLVYALGGVTQEAAPALLAAGADGVALIGAALSAPPRALLAALRIER